MSSFCKCKSYSLFFSKNISICAIFNGQSFNDTLTNDIVSFVTLGPDGRVVSTPNFGSQGPGFISCWRQNSTHDCMACIAQSLSLSPSIISIWIKWAAPCKNMSLGICRQLRPRSACASAQSGSGPSLSTNRMIRSYRMYILRAKAWMIFCTCTGRSEYVHFVYTQWQFFAWRGPNNVERKIKWQTIIMSCRVRKCILWHAHPGKTHFLPHFAHLHSLISLCSECSTDSHESLKVLFGGQRTLVNLHS